MIICSQKYSQPYQISNQNLNIIKPASLNSPSFTSLQLFDVRVKELDEYGKYMPTKAFFSKLYCKDKADRAAIFDIEKEWENAKYTTFFADNFDNWDCSDFWALELCYPQKLKDKIICLAKTSTEKDSQSGETCLEIRFVESKNKINKNNFRSNSQNRAIKDAGGVMIYSLIKYAQLNNINKISFKSTNDDFYRKLGITGEGENLGWATQFIIDNADYQKNLEILEEKYGFRVQIKTA